MVSPPEDGMYVGVAVGESVVTGGVVVGTDVPGDVVGAIVGDDVLATVGATVVGTAVVTFSVALVGAMVGANDVVGEGDTVVLAGVGAAVVAFSSFSNMIVSTDGRRAWVRPAELKRRTTQSNATSSRLWLRFTWRCSFIISFMLDVGKHERWEYSWNALLFESSRFSCRLRVLCAGAVVRVLCHSRRAENTPQKTRLSLLSAVPW